MTDRVPTEAAPPRRRGRTLLLASAVALMLAAAVAAHALVVGGWGELFGPPAASRDALAEEMAVINAYYSADWDARRGEATDDAHRARMRREWRRAYDAEVLACYRRHGRTPPAHLTPVK